jgi:hypothetical protein
VELLGPAFVEVLRENVNAALTELVRQELDAAEPERKLALRHLEQAVHRYGVVMESLAAVLRSSSEADRLALVEALLEKFTRVNPVLTEDERVVLRLELDVIVALDSLDTSLDELTFWAFRAINDARRVEALPAPAMPVGLRGEIARVRARRAWLGWDAAEVAKELEPWTRPSP